MMLRGLSRHFSYRVNARSVIAPTKGLYNPLLSREELKSKAEHPDLALEKLKEKIEIKNKLVDQYHHNLGSNDSNPSNFITNLRVIKTPESQLSPKIPEPKIPDVIIYRRDPQAPTITGRLGRCKGSVKKISPVMRMIRGLHINEAMNKMKHTHNRAAKRVYSALNMVKHHAIDKGYNELRLYVKDAITNRQKRIKGIRYHAKMRRGLQKRDWCSLRITLIEKPASEFFKDIVGGKAPLGVVNLWKDKIMKSPRAFDLIRKFQFILTAKGRQQRREMIRRKAYVLQTELAVD